MISELVPLAPMLDGRARQEALGQFLTPSPVGDFMASLFSTLPRDVRLIDAGAGEGGLTAAFVRRACAKGSKVKSIHATAYEVDSKILAALRETLAHCDSICQKRGIRFTAEVHHADFIQTMAGKLSGDLFSTAAPSFNVAIANPPYKKINAGSPERLALPSLPRNFVSQKSFTQMTRNDSFTFQPTRDTPAPLRGSRICPQASLRLA